MNAGDQADAVELVSDGPVARALRVGFAEMATRQSALGGLQAVRNCATAIAPVCANVAQRGDVSDALLEQATRCGLLEDIGVGGEGAVLDAIRAGFEAARVERVEFDPAAKWITPSPWNPENIEATLPLAFLDATTLAGVEVPPRRWLVPHRIPRPAVTMLSGDGAAGKTTIALQLAVGTVCGTDWLGAVVTEPGPAIFYTGEEDQDEVHRRLDAITAHHGIGFADLKGLHLLCRPTEDPMLGIPDGKSGVVRPTPLFERLLKTAKEIRPALIVIEAAADVFAGNENDRAQVRQFVALLRRLAIEADAAVLLIAHPSLTGLTSGTGTSGSTGWNNSVRSRLYFHAPKARDNDEADTDVRQLEVMKSNYGPKGEAVRLCWQRGVFVPVGGAAPLAQVAAEADVDQAYLECLDAATGQGRVVFAKTGNGFAPKTFEKMPQARGFKTGALHKAQERLFAAGRIHVVASGPPSRAVHPIARKPVAEAAE